MSDSSLTNLEEFFLALSDGTRLRLLGLMRHGEVSVGYLSDELGQSQPKISRHLAYLRSAGLVETRRDGKWVYYRISELPSISALEVLNGALDWVDVMSGRTVKQDYLSRPNFPKAPPVETIHVIAEDEADERYSNEMEIYLL